MAESLQKQAAVSESETEADSIGKKRPLDGDSSEGASGAPEDDGVNKRLKADDQPEENEKPSKRRHGQKIERTGPLVDQPEYYIENGLRKVRPYWLRFVTCAKGRWIGRKLGEVFEHELYAKDPSFFVEQAKLGRITVNDKPTTLDYILKNNDIIKNIVHRHEMPVLDRAIEIVQADDEVVIVNKPCSLPAHQCGRYYFNSLTYLLKHQFGMDGLRITHRLDRLTSGLMILAKTLAKSQDMYASISGRDVRKEYLARVVGVFPDEDIVCDQPIGSLFSKMGVHGVSPDGKFALTRFKKLFDDGKESVVKCIPETGRTHQIRVHLQYLGYPIVNDVMYNNTVFGPAKGKGGDYGKPMEQLVNDINNEFCGAAWIDDFDSSLAAYVEKRPESSLDAPSAKPDLSSPYYDAHCADCHMQSRDPPSERLEMYLHCLRYEGPNWSYSTPMPKWAIPQEEGS